MSYLVYILAPIVVFLVLAVSVTLRAADSPKSGVPAQPAKAPAAQTPLPPAREMATFSNAKLREMLAKTAVTPAPALESDQVLLAMCYSVAPPPERVEYTCPTCNKKTIYAFPTKSWGDKDASQKFQTQNLVAFELVDARRLIKEIQKYAPAVRLRENSFCKQCNPKGGTPNLGIVIRYDDGTEITTDNVSSYDLRILVDFFSGAHKTGNDGKVLSWEDMQRLKQLLGEPVTPTPSKNK